MRAKNPRPPRGIKPPRVIVEDHREHAELVK